MNVGLLFDLQTDPRDPRQAEFDPPAVVEALEAALVRLGHQVLRLGGPRDLLAHPPKPGSFDLVFNIAEGAEGRCREAWAPMLLELLHLPYVGSDALALSLGLDKAVCKQLATAGGVPTPPWVTIERPEDLPAARAISFPVIVKPRYEGSGAGIDEDAVVSDRAGLERRVRACYAVWKQPMILESFVPGGELTVCVVGNDPPTAYPAIQRPIDPATGLSVHVARRSTTWEAPLVLSEELDAKARSMSVAMFQALGCWDLARVDLRVDAQGQPWFLEINPLPSFDPEGTIGLLAEHLGETYHGFVGRILDAAVRRLQKPVSR